MFLVSNTTPPPLRGVVCIAAGGAFETLDTRECHDRTALAVHPGLLDHPGHRGLGDQERAGEVDGDHSLPLGAVTTNVRALARSPLMMHPTRSACSTALPWRRLRRTR